MELSKQELTQIVERASILAERLGPPFQPRPAAEDERLIKTRLEQWRQVAAQDDSDKFAQRLAWDGLNVATASKILGAVELCPDQPLPEWTETLQAALQATTSLSDNSAFLDPQEPLPFEDVLLPFVEVARQNLMKQAGTNYGLLTKPAHTSLERGLLIRLAHLCAQTLNLEFSIFRLRKQPDLLEPWGQPASVPGRKLYQEFVGEMLGGKLRTLFHKYSVLARLVATATDFWVEANIEFLQRLALDQAKIQQTFQAQAELGQVVSIQPAMSDPHYRGRSVMVIQFASGLRLVYKPRSLGLEVVYFQLLAWLNEHGAPLPFKLLQVLSQATHGWVEYVSPTPCQDEAEARRYYRRAGMLLAILYTLDATDCHFQNIIACGEQPVLIDLDMLISHQVSWAATDDSEKGVLMLANQQLLDSVIRTGFVPRWEFDAGGQAVYDLSGLGAVGEQEIQQQVAYWRDINQDGMRIGYQLIKLESHDNSPLSAGLKLAQQACDEALIAGFQQMYLLLLEHQAALLAPASPLTNLARQYPRFMLRNTRGYFNILQKSLQPKFLRDGADRSIQLDILSRWMQTFGERPPCWPLLALEQEALAQLDIPYFAAPANDNALPLSAQQKIEQFFGQPSFNRVMDRLGRLNKADLARQVDIIRASAYARLTADPHQTALEDEDKSFHPSSLTRSIQPSALVQQAVKIAQELQERAISPANGRVAAWLGLDYLPELQRYQLQPLRYDFYSGNGGIALFLAALAQVSGDTQFERQALSALQLIRQALPQLASIRSGSDADKIIKATYLGGAVGFGSLLYVLVRVSQLLADSTLLAEAGQVAALITPELIAADTKFDVMLGASGAILGLLTLYQATTDPAVLAQAVTCGRHLLAKRVASPTGHQVWPTLHGKFLTGFAHGAAGIAYALLRLHQTLQGTMMAEDGISDPSSFLTAAEEAMNYERSLFSVEAGNWPDLRKPTEMPAFATGWCHGASGIGLARLGAWEMLSTPLICQDIEAALYLTQRAGLADVDHLCCGNFGRLELLLVASRCLSRPELEDMAQQQAAWLVNRANQTGSFQLFPSQAQVIYQPGFFQGTAGIGYQLLRLAQPDLLPSALLWA